LVLPHAPASNSRGWLCGGEEQGLDPYDPGGAAQRRRRWILWRPRFLINVINANDRISQVKPVEHWSKLGQPESSPRKPRQWILLNPLTKSTHNRGQPFVKDTVKTGLTIDVGECRPELLPRSLNFT
jgi:hypothetical protein